MRDLVTEELISAYLDNEVTDEERRLVEQALAQSSESRRLFEELKILRGSLQGMPRLKLPEDFHLRVLGEVERQSAIDAEPVQPATRVPPSRRIPAWLKAATAIASLAALLLFAFTLASVWEQPAIVDQDPVSEDGTLTSHPDGDQYALGPNLGRPKPIQILVYDLAITESGQDDRVFEKALKQAGIEFNPEQPGAKLEKELEKDLLGSRFIGDIEKEDDTEQDGAKGKAKPLDVIEMVYVRGTGKQIDDLYATLTTRQNTRRDVHMKLDLAIDPQARGVLNNIGGKTWTLAVNDAPANPYSRAYRIHFEFVLHSGPASLAKFPIPSLRTQLVPTQESTPSDTPRFDVDLLRESKIEQPTEDVKPANLADNQPDAPGDIFEILVILRNLKALPK